MTCNLSSFLKGFSSYFGLPNKVVSLGYRLVSAEIRLNLMCDLYGNLCHGNKESSKVELNRDVGLFLAEPR